MYNKQAVFQGSLFSVVGSSPKNIPVGDFYHTILTG